MTRTEEIRARVVYLINQGGLELLAPDSELDAFIVQVSPNPHETAQALLQAADSLFDALTELTALQDELDDMGTTMRAIMEETVLAGYEGGDRVKTLANVRALREENARLRAALKWIADQEDLTFAESTLAERIISTAREALSPEQVAAPLKPEQQAAGEQP